MRAKTIVQSIKETTVSTKNRLVRRDEVPEPLDVADYSALTRSTAQVSTEEISTIEIQHRGS